jgi:hypothetical protein
LGIQENDLWIAAQALEYNPVLPTSPRESLFSIAYSHPDGRNPTTWRRS